jgi:hypothetical protein
MDVCHAVFNNTTNLFQAFVCSHRANRISLDEDVGIREQFESFQGRPIWSKDTLPAFHKPFFVLHQVPNLDHIAGNLVIKNFDRLCAKESVGV